MVSPLENPLTAFKADLKELLEKHKATIYFAELSGFSVEFLGHGEKQLKGDTWLEAEDL